MTGYIYIIRNTINDKVYIGQTRYPIEHRFKQHLKLLKSNSNQLIHKAIVKYGKDKFYIEELEECLIKDLNSREKHWIQYFNSCENGYNIFLGGFSKIGKVLEEEQICQLYIKGLSQREIAKMYNVGHKLIGNILKKHKIEARNKNCKLIKYNKISKDHLIEELMQNNSLSQIARNMHVNKSAVIKAIKRFNINLTEYKK